MTGLSETDRQDIVAWASRHPEIQEVYLFGSRARGDHQPDSDIDLAIVMPFEEWFEWPGTNDLHLSYPAHLEWYQMDAGLDRVGKGIEADGILVYARSSGFS